MLGISRGIDYPIEPMTRHDGVFKPAKVTEHLLEFATSSCLRLFLRRTPPGSRINRREFLSRDAHGHSRHAAHHIDFARIAEGSGGYAGIRMRDKFQYAVLDFDPAARIPRPDVQEIDRTLPI